MVAQRGGITSIALTVLIATMIIVILVGTYAAITFDGGSETSMTCAESVATFAVLENGSTVHTSFPIPADPCQHRLTLEGFTLNSTSEGVQYTLGGMLHVDSKSQLVGLILYMNGSYELYNAMTPIKADSYTFQYSTVLGNASAPIFFGMNYTVEFVAIFKDGTATTASATLRAG